MKIIELQWRNIFSYGNNIETINFGDSEQLWQLSGVSGAGKSSLLTIPKLLFYGKHEGQDGKSLKVNDIANWINKNGWIKGTVKKGDDIYTIVRTFAPSGLELYKNGESLDKAGLKNMQDIIESEVLDGLPYHIFSNVVSLSLNNFKSFISMSPADKRAIIDKIFSLEIINKVHELVKKDMKDLGNAINMSNSQIHSLEQTVNVSVSELESLKQRNTESDKSIAEEIAVKLGKIADMYKQQNDTYGTYYNMYNEVQNSENALLCEINKSDVEIRDVNTKLNLFKESKCPTCGTPFEGTAFDSLRDTLSKRIDELTNTKNGYSDNLNAIRQKKNELSTGLNTLRSNIQKLTEKQSQLTAELNSVKQRMNSTDEFESIQKIISETNATKADVEKNVQESNAKMGMLNIIEGAYSSDGIKRKLMDSYIPVLNDEIRSALEFLGFPYGLEFDNNFDPTLTYIGKPISPANVSTGEHKKLDLAVLCAIIRMVKRKYPQINIMCLDETVSSLDYESSSDVIKYLKELSAEMGMNLFVVSHTQLDENLFDRHLYIEKNNGFTIIKREEEK